MKHYFIKTFRREESEKVMAVLKTILGDIPIKRESAICNYETISFDCNDKQVWKTIKNELGLEVISIFSQIRVK